MSGGSSAGTTIGGLALAGLVVVAVVGQINGWWCGEQCQLNAARDREARAQLGYTAPPPAYHAGAGGYAPPREFQPIGHRRASDGRTEGTWSRERPGFEKWDGMANQAGLTFNDSSGFWEKDKVVPCGTPPPPQDWKPDGPGRGRWVLKQDNCARR